MTTQRTCRTRERRTTVIRSIASLESGRATKNVNPMRRSLPLLGAVGPTIALLLGVPYWLYVKDRAEKRERYIRSVQESVQRCLTDARDCTSGDRFDYSSALASLKNATEDLKVHRPTLPEPIYVRLSTNVKRAMADLTTARKDRDQREREQAKRREADRLRQEAAARQQRQAERVEGEPRQQQVVREQQEASRRQEADARRERERLAREMAAEDAAKKAREQERLRDAAAAQERRAAADALETAHELTKQELRGALGSALLVVARSVAEEHMPLKDVMNMPFARQALPKRPWRCRLSCVTEVRGRGPGVAFADASLQIESVGWNSARRSFTVAATLDSIMTQGRGGPMRGHILSAHFPINASDAAQKQMVALFNAGKLDVSVVWEPVDVGYGEKEAVHVAAVLARVLKLTFSEEGGGEARSLDAHQQRTSGDALPEAQAGAEPIQAAPGHELTRESLRKGGTAAQILAAANLQDALRSLPPQPMSREVFEDLPVRPWRCKLSCASGSVVRGPRLAFADTSLRIHDVRYNPKLQEFGIYAEIDSLTSMGRDNVISGYLIAAWLPINASEGDQRSMKELFAEGRLAVSVVWEPHKLAYTREDDVRVVTIDGRVLEYAYSSVP